MRPRKYALESLARLRAGKADEATRDLAAAVGEHEAADRRRLEAERSCAEHDASARRVQEEETEALARGELSAADLARAGAFQIRADSEREALGLAARGALADVLRASSKEQDARGELAKRHAESEVLIQDEKRWRERLRATAEAQDDETASEAWRPPRAR